MCSQNHEQKDELPVSDNNITLPSMSLSNSGYVIDLVFDYLVKSKNKTFMELYNELFAN